MKQHIIDKVKNNKVLQHKLGKYEVRQILYLIIKTLCTVMRSQSEVNVETSVLYIIDV